MKEKHIQRLNKQIELKVFKEKIIKTYNIMLGRNPTPIELKKNSHKSENDILLNIFHSDEFKNKVYPKVVEDNSEIVYDTTIFVINLETSINRREYMVNQFKKLNINKYEFFKAVNGKLLSEDDLNTHYEKEKSSKLYRPLGLGEIGCALSHVNVAKEIIYRNLPFAIILEDDVLLTNEFKKILPNLYKLDNINFDFIMLGAFTSNEFWNGKLKTKNTPSHITELRSVIYLDKPESSLTNEIYLHKPHHPTHSIDFIHGTHGYIMSKSGAEKVIKFNYPVFLESDNVWNFYNNEVSLLIINPLVCHQNMEDFVSLLNKDRAKFKEIYEKSTDGRNWRIYHSEFGR
jgi:glycosyl transferase, family 25